MTGVDIQDEQTCCVHICSYFISKLVWSFKYKLVWIWVIFYYISESSHNKDLMVIADIANTKSSY